MKAVKAFVELCRAAVRHDASRLSGNNSELSNVWVTGNSNSGKKVISEAHAAVIRIYIGDRSCAC